MMKRWEHFSHQADIGVRGTGTTPADAFAQAALALTAVVCPPDKVVPAEPVEVSCSSHDLETLLVDWLNAVVLEMAARRMLFGRFEVGIEGLNLKASMWGEGVDVDRHSPAVEVKAATYNSLQVRQTGDGLWIAQCVVDV
jgi:SHS2 domain-containing protein